MCALDTQTVTDRGCDAAQIDLLHSRHFSSSQQATHRYNCGYFRVGETLLADYKCIKTTEINVEMNQHKEYLASQFFLLPPRKYYINSLTEFVEFLRWWFARTAILLQKLFFWLVRYLVNTTEHCGEEPIETPNMLLILHVL